MSGNNKQATKTLPPQEQHHQPGIESEMTPLPKYSKQIIKQQVNCKTRRR